MIRTWSRMRNLDREAYERNLKKRQAEHIKRVRNRGGAWRPRLHEQCPACHGTGVKVDGSPCIHMISCPCPKCSPQF